MAGPDEQHDQEVEDERTFREAFGTAEAGEALTRALAELREIARDLLELSQLKVERARTGMRAGVFNVGVAGWLYVAGIATTIVAAWYLIDGVAGGLGGWLGQAWAGRALAGGATLALIVTAVAWLRAVERRSNLARLKRKFPEDDDDRA
jgi:hypothetical protein